MEQFVISYTSVWIMAMKPRTEAMILVFWRKGIARRKMPVEINLSKFQNIPYCQTYIEMFSHVFIFLKCLPFHMFLVHSSETWLFCYFWHAQLSRVWCIFLDDKIPFILIPSYLKLSMQRIYGITYSTTKAVILKIVFLQIQHWNRLP